MFLFTFICIFNKYSIVQNICLIISLQESSSHVDHIGKALTEYIIQHKYKHKNKIKHKSALWVPLMVLYFHLH